MHRTSLGLSFVTVVCLLAAVAGGETIKINFQTQESTTPRGYLPDSGRVFGDRHNGYIYGWNRDVSADARDRDSGNAPDQRYDTLVHFSKSGIPARWEITLPNGTYSVFLVCGDPSYTDQTNHIDVEGHILIDEDPQSSSAGNFDEFQVTVTVGDGRLTITATPQAANPKIMFVEITSVSSGDSPGGSSGAYSGGSGTTDDPYEIATAQDLLELGSTPEDYGKSFILTADIDLSQWLFDRAVIAADTDDNSAGYQGTPFSGNFNGQGHVIRNLRIQGECYLGLFGNASSYAVIASLGLEATDINGVDTFIGGLVGYNGGNVLSSYSTGTVAGTKGVGGLVGFNRGSVLSSNSAGTVAGMESIGGLVGNNWGNLSFSHSTCAVSGTENVGGVLGVSWEGDISSCHSTGSVNGTRRVGGLVGYSSSSNISSSYSAGAVSGEERVGGLAGEHSGGNISSSRNSGTVRGAEYVGGVAGYNNGGISFSYSTGQVSGEERVGGLAGANGRSIAASYSLGTVTGTIRVGGLVGYSWGSRRAWSCFWNTETSGLTESAEGTGLRTADMQNIDTYLEAGWDSIGETVNGSCDFWLLENGAYPELASLSGVAPLELAGAGTAENPYLITNADELGSVWYRPTSHYRLDADIGLSGVVWGAAVIPGFSGVFDGNGFRIGSLRIQGAGYLGLFGFLGSQGEVTELGLDDVDVEGIAYGVAGLVAENEGSIVSTYVTGIVSGDHQVGGLVGCHFGGIASSYSDGWVTGERYVGGLVGSVNASSARVSSCYSVATASGSENVGGLVGQKSGGSILASFWDVHTSGQATSAAGTGMTTADMQKQTNYTSAGWDFVGETGNGTDDIWKMPSGDGYPLLAWQEESVSNASTDDFETGTFSVFDYSHAGDVLWSVDWSASASGTYSARSGDIDHSESSRLMLTRECQAGRIRFMAKVSSEADFDILHFRIDGQEMDAWSGDLDWTEVSYSISTGSHTFEWSYKKDGSQDEGEDAAWIDDITFLAP